MSDGSSNALRSDAWPEGAVQRGSDVDALAAMVARGRVVVLTGAGCSTESGIPDYRGPRGTLRSRSPMRYQEFTGSERARARYWSRSSVGWRRFSGARPNAGHRAIAELERRGLVEGVITQNVDGLHQAGGASNVIELHGSLSRVRCLGCGSVESRGDFQVRLEELNPTPGSNRGPLLPDGDVDLPAGSEAAFRIPGCSACRGAMKPDVVFFGENVPRDRLERCWELYRAADALLVVGSSLQVFSGRRFVHRAVDDGVPVAIVNMGPTRCDEDARVRVEGRCGEVLTRLVRAVVPSGRGAGPA